MNTIRPEDSSEDNLSLPSTPRYRRKSRRKPKYFSAYDFSRSPSLSPVRRKTSKNKKMNKNANANVANDVGQEDGQNGKLDEASKRALKLRLTNADRAKLKASTQFTEMQMMSLWNKFKMDCPTGQMNRVQLRQLFKDVSTYTAAKKTFPTQILVLNRCNLTSKNSPYLAGNRIFFGVTLNLMRRLIMKA